MDKLERVMKLVGNVITQSRRLEATAPVDDDFPQVKHEFDSAVLDYADYLKGARHGRR